MRKLVAIVMLLLAALCVVGYVRTEPHPKAASLRTGYLVGAMLTSGTSWWLFRKSRGLPTNT